MNKISQKNIKTIKNLNTQLKDKTDTTKKSNVIYNIPCNICNFNYIGTTSRILNDRTTSHKSDIKLNKKSCALAQHSIEAEHKPNYPNIKILRKEKNISKRLFLEMVEINKSSNCVNKKTDIDNLSNIYK